MIPELTVFFELNGTSYKQDTFASNIGITSSAFVINTKGIKLDDYKFNVYMEALPASYAALDLSKNQIVTSSAISENSKIIYGIVKIRKKTETSFDGETIRDAKFIITPIEKLGN